MAYASFHCKAYARALMHFEAFVSSQKQDIQQHLGFIQKLYIALDEPDGVAGVAASRKRQPTLHEQILDQKSSGMANNSPTCEIAVDCEQNVFFSGWRPVIFASPLAFYAYYPDNIKFTCNNQRLRSAGDNDRRSKRFCSITVLVCFA